MRQRDPSGKFGFPRFTLMKSPVFLACLLGFFNTAKLKHTPGILLGRYGPPTGTVPEKALEVGFS